MRIDLPNLEFINAKLRAMALEAATLIKETTGEEAVVTSLFRIGDKGVHGQLPLRAIDLRCDDAVVGTAIAGKINAVWSYDPNRRWMSCVMYHDVGQGPHLHLQVHPNTVRAEK